MTAPLTPKTIDQHFLDWESTVFGFGYGTGEEFTIPAIRTFFDACPMEGNYDHKLLEDRLTPTVAWLLINTFAHADIIEYGTSPRFGWLSATGKQLKEYLHGKSTRYLFKVYNERGDDYSECYPDHCNCDTANGRDVLPSACGNPFWKAAR
jgi:hypothetical protein